LPTHRWRLSRDARFATTWKTPRSLCMPVSGGFWPEKRLDVKPNVLSLLAVASIFVFLDLMR